MGVVVNRLVVVVVVVNWGVVNRDVVNRAVETRRAVGHGVCFVSGRIKS